MTETTNPKRRRWIMPLLFASLAINLLIAGIVLGTLFVSGGERPDRASREVSTLVGPHFFRALEPKDRRALIRDIGKERDQVRENREALRDRIERLLGLLRAETLDVDAVRSLLEEQRNAVASRHMFGEGLLLNRLAEMSDIERAEFAERLEQSLRKRRP